MLIGYCIKIYISALSALPGVVHGFQAEEFLLELHQLRPEDVLLGQDACDHGLGLVSGQICLGAQETMEQCSAKAT